ncbi:glycoside hydrolase family 5 protein [Anaerocolumna xylanovorans]|uniref:Cellulase (Glycosyl hydrolase family 5) n=1 Tax=Anaerocolumna xylanovorans DSM 12503 TaxID=1121345 RepID=A0A1M7XX04_9FIRM|nr:cellulase family glycosylhydrolase [Anaerocolumna xylanovorans]SHO43356.1 Cellulase (glycosyl hydrolase family 5) [Anaerocolumna xylanovorans DSM 12503]
MVTKMKVVNGRLIENGKEIVLRGVNLGGWLIQESWMCPVSGEDRKWANLDTLNILEERFGKEQAQKLIESYQDNWITEWDIQNIADKGLNAIRVPFWYRNFMTGEEGNWIEENFSENPGFKRLDWVIEIAEKYGIYVILDMHGCPGGQSMDHCCGTLCRNDLYTSEEHLKSMEKLWIAIAGRYKDNKTVAVYDIMNEPQNNGGYEGEHSYDPFQEESWQMSNAVYDRMIKAIRKIDKEHIITAEGIWRVSNLPDPEEMGWDNMMYQTHLYDDDENFHNWTLAMAKTREKYGVAGYVGEFQNLNGISMCNEQGLSWTTWSYKGTKDVKTFFWYVEELPKADVKNDSYEEILLKWGEVLRTEHFTEQEVVTKAVNLYSDGRFEEYKEKINIPEK